MFENWVPPEFYWMILLIVILGGSWIVFGLWHLFAHLSIGWL
jgi:hypothetical protein